MKSTILKALLISLTALTATDGYAAKLYKWVDENGNISYQDQPPPKKGQILSEKTITSSAERQKDKDLPEVVVYSAEECNLCERLVSVLRKNKIPHIERQLEDDDEAKNKILEKEGSLIAPSIFIGEKLIQTGSEYGLKEALRSAGFTIASQQTKHQQERVSSVKKDSQSPAI